MISEVNDLKFSIDKIEPILQRQKDLTKSLRSDFINYQDVLDFQDLNEKTFLMNSIIIGEISAKVKTKNEMLLIELFKKMLEFQQQNLVIANYNLTIRSALNFEQSNEKHMQSFLKPNKFDIEFLKEKHFKGEKRPNLSVLLFSNNAQKEEKQNMDKSIEISKTLKPKRIISEKKEKYQNLKKTNKKLDFSDSKCMKQFDSTFDLNPDQMIAENNEGIQNYDTFTGLPNCDCQCHVLNPHLKKQSQYDKIKYEYKFAKINEEKKKTHIISEIAQMNEKFDPAFEHEVDKLIESLNAGRGYTNPSKRNLLIALKASERITTEISNSIKEGIVKIQKELDESYILGKRDSNSESIINHLKDFLEKNIQKSSEKVITEKKFVEEIIDFKKLEQEIFVKVKKYIFECVKNSSRGFFESQYKMTKNEEISTILTGQMIDEQENQTKLILSEMELKFANLNRKSDAQIYEIDCLQGNMKEMSNQINEQKKNLEFKQDELNVIEARYNESQIDCKKITELKNTSEKELFKTKWLMGYFSKSFYKLQNFLIITVMRLKKNDQNVNQLHKSKVENSLGFEKDQYLAYFNNCLRILDTMSDIKYDLFEKLAFKNDKIENELLNLSKNIDLNSSEIVKDDEIQSLIEALSKENKEKAEMLIEKNKEEIIVKNNNNKLDMDQIIEKKSGLLNSDFKKRTKKVFENGELKSRKSKSLKNVSKLMKKLEKSDFQTSNGEYQKETSNLMVFEDNNEEFIQNNLLNKFKGSSRSSQKICKKSIENTISFEQIDEKSSIHENYSNGFLMNTKIKSFKSEKKRAGFECFKNEDISEREELRLHEKNKKIKILYPINRKIIDVFNFKINRNVKINNKDNIKSLEKIAVKKDDIEKMKDCDSNFSQIDKSQDKMKKLKKEDDKIKKKQHEIKKIKKEDDDLNFLNGENSPVFDKTSKINAKSRIIDNKSKKDDSNSILPKNNISKADFLKPEIFYESDKLENSASEHIKDVIISKEDKNMQQYLLDLAEEGNNLIFNNLAKKNENPQIKKNKILTIRKMFDFIVFENKVDKREEIKSITNRNNLKKFIKKMSKENLIEKTQKPEVLINSISCKKIQNQIKNDSIRAKTENKLSRWQIFQTLTFLNKSKKTRILTSSKNDKTMKHEIVDFRYNFYEKQQISKNLSASGSTINVLSDQKRFHFEKCLISIKTREISHFKKMLTQKSDELSLNNKIEEKLMTMPINDLNAILSNILIFRGEIEKNFDKFDSDDKNNNNSILDLVLKKHNFSSLFDFKKFYKTLMPYFGNNCLISNKSVDFDENQSMIEICFKQIEQESKKKDQIKNALLQKRQINVAHVLNNSSNINNQLPDEMKIKNTPKNDRCASPFKKIETSKPKIVKKEHFELDLSKITNCLNLSKIAKEKTNSPKKSEYCLPKITFRKNVNSSTKNKNEKSLNIKSLRVLHDRNEHYIKNHQQMSQLELKEDLKILHVEGINQSKDQINLSKNGFLKRNVNKKSSGKKYKIIV